MNAIPDQLPLRDIHLPDPVSWFPPAIGWWLVLLLVLLVFFLLWLLIRILKKPVLNKQAVMEIEAVIESYNLHRNTMTFLQALSAALKRIGMSYFSRNQVAGLSGVRWIHQLNSLVSKNRLTETQVELLAVVPYQKSPIIVDEQIQALIEQVRQWSRALPRLKQEKVDV